MLLAVVLAIVFATLAVLIARTSAEALRKRRSDDRPRVPPAELRGVVIELLQSLGLTVVEEELRGPARRLVLAQRPGAERVPRFVVFVEPAPPDDVVRPELVYELASTVRALDAAVGLMVTPYAIESAGLKLPAPVQLYDGPRLHALVARHLPERAAELERYRGFADRALTPNLAPQL